MTQKVLAFVYFIFIARLLSVENVGQYTVAMSFTTIFSILIDLGTGPVITRAIAQQKDKLNSLLNSILGAKAFLSVAVYLAVIIAMHFMNYPESTQRLIYISGIVMIIDSIVLSVYSAFRGLHNLAYEALGIIVNQFAAMTFGLLGLFFIARDPIVIVLAFLFGATMNLAFACRQIHRNYDIKIRPNLNKIELKAIFLPAVPFALSGIFTKVYSYIDAIILQKYLGDAAVGLYSVAYKIPFALQFIPSALSASLYASMSTYYQKDNKKIEELWEHATRSLLLISVPMLCGLYLLADVVILRFYSVQYEASVAILQLLVLGLVFMFLNFPLGSLIAATNNQPVNMTLMGITMVINVTANILLIPEFGTFGAGYAFLLSHGSLFVGSLLYSRRLIKIPFLSLLGYFIKIVISAAIMSFVVLAVKNSIHWILSIPAGVLVYGACSLVFKLTTVKELKQFIPKRGVIAE